jgi:hypothetical protein
MSTRGLTSAAGAAPPGGGEGEPGGDGVGGPGGRVDVPGGDVDLAGGGGGAGSRRHGHNLRKWAAGAAMSTRGLTSAAGAAPPGGGEGEPGGDGVGGPGGERSGEGEALSAGNTRWVQPPARL